MDSIGQEWRNQILSGVAKIPACGSPGNMVVLGRNAEPILTGRTPKDVFIAAAQLGKGRIFVLGHDAYPNWFLNKSANERPIQRFCQNVLAWVTKNQYSSLWRLQNFNHDKDLTKEVKEKVLIIPASQNYDQSFANELVSQVKNGLALIIGVTPWGWVQIHETDLELSCTYLLLKEAGIFLTMNITEWEFGARGAEVETNQAAHAHCGTWLANFHKKQNFNEHDAYLASALHSIPEDDIGNILRDILSSRDISRLCPCPPSEDKLLRSSHRCGALLLSFLAFRSNIVGKLPGIEHFPGDFKTPPPTMSKDVQITCTLSDVHATGAYLVAGCTLSIEILENSAQGTWGVQVGAHSDDLSDKEELKRWPQLVIRKSLRNGVAVRVQSPVGGLIYICSPGECAQGTFRLSNIVEAPLFRAADPSSNSHWPEICQSPGLWADFVGKHIHITVPSHTIRDLADPHGVSLVLEFWDRVVLAHHNLRGLDADKSRRQWIVPDIQPSAGYMHSGYPIVTHLDATESSNDMWLMRFPSNQNNEEHWGYFHEIGHNMQDGDWTFDGTVEVTCNIFTLHAMLVMFGIQPWNHSWLERQKKAMISYLKEGANFSKWKENPGIGLGIYAQLARDFSFEAYKKVFHLYNTEVLQFENNQKKIDKWIQMFSNVVERNLVPSFKFWGFPVSNFVISDLTSFQPYIPEDELSKAVPERILSIKKEFNMI